MATKKSNKAKKPTVTNLDRLDMVIMMAKNGKFRNAEYTKALTHLKKVLAPVIKGEIIKEILALHKAGRSNKEIVEAGYNKTTVSRQVKEYKTKTTYAIDIAIADEEGEEDNED